MFWLAATAFAGPLDQPDPDDMGLHHCRDRFLGPVNNVEIGDLTEAAPGAVTFAEGLASSLLPYASDADLKKASKGKVNYARAAVASLGSEGRAVVLGCSIREATAQDDFQVGCEKPIPCQLSVVLHNKAYALDRANLVGPRMAPIESAKEALGLVALLDDTVFVPLTPEEKAAWAEEASGFKAVDADVPWVDVQREDEGFVVRAPRRLPCGPDRDIVRRAWWVSNEGRTCMLEETPIPLAQAQVAADDL